MYSRPLCLDRLPIAGAGEVYSEGVGVVGTDAVEEFDGGGFVAFKFIGIDIQEAMFLLF